MQPGEMLYNTNDAANAIYFIYQGTFRLMIDINEFKQDDHDDKNKGKLKVT